MPAGVDLVVNLARESFLEHVNTGLSSENFGLYAQGGICRKSAARLCVRRIAERDASAATSRSDSRDIKIYCPFRHDARDGCNCEPPPREIESMSQNRHFCVRVTILQSTKLKNKGNMTDTLR